MNNFIRETILRTIESKNISIEPPYEKTGGNLELTARLAVFDNDKFWGITSMTIDLFKMLEDLNISDLNKNFNFALTDDEGTLFYGRFDKLDSDPLIMNIKLPESFWKLYATPQGGWNSIVNKGALINL